MASDPDLVNRLLSAEIESGSLEYELQRAIASLVSTSNQSEHQGKCFDIRQFMEMNVPSFQGNIQQDIYEFKNWIDEKMESIIPGWKKDMALQFQHILNCSVCQTLRITKREKGDLLLSIPDISGKQTTLQTLIDHHLELQVMDDVHCSVCGKRTTHEKQTVCVNDSAPISIWTLIKLFDSRQQKKQIRVENNGTVTLVINGSRVQFHAVAQAQHIGPAINSGHYISQFKDMQLSEPLVKGLSETPEDFETRQQAQEQNWIENNDECSKIVNAQPSEAGYLVLLKQVRNPGSLETRTTNKSLAEKMELLPMLEKETNQTQGLCSFFFGLFMLVSCMQIRTKHGKWAGGITSGDGGSSSSTGQVCFPSDKIPSYFGSNI